MQQAAEVFRSRNRRHVCSAAVSDPWKGDAGTGRYRRVTGRCDSARGGGIGDALLLRSTKTLVPRPGLLVVAILIANAGADQAKRAERIKLYDFLKIPVLIDGCTKLGSGFWRHRFEIVWISHVRS